MLETHPASAAAAQTVKHILISILFTWLTTGMIPKPCLPLHEKNGLFLLFLFCPTFAYCSKRL
jgi:hypothetical protein